MGIRKIFKDVLRDIIKWSTNDNDIIAYDSSMGNKVQRKSAMVQMSQSLEDNNNGMKFTVYGATGGKIIQIQRYDSRTDRHSAELYIVTDKEDLGEEIAMIITRESLTR